MFKFQLSVEDASYTIWKRGWNRIRNTTFLCSQCISIVKKQKDVVWGVRVTFQGTLFAFRSDVLHRKQWFLLVDELISSYPCSLLTYQTFLLVYMSNFHFSFHILISVSLLKCIPIDCEIIIWSACRYSHSKLDSLKTSVFEGGSNGLSPDAYMKVWTYDTIFFRSHFFYCYREKCLYSLAWAIKIVELNTQM